MPTAKKLTVPSSEDVRSEAIQMLIKQMGITKAAIFIRENAAHTQDYLKIKGELFGKKTAQQLYDEVRKRKS